MATSINADNGAVSGSAGLKSSADSSGVLALQTNGTTAVSISAAQVVSYTNQPVYSGGTANGVAYLNGSKVLTTGSALVFDGTNLGIGTTSPVSQLHITPSTANVFTEGLRVNREGQTGQYAIVNYSNGIGRFVAVDSLFNSPSIGFFTSSDGSTQTERARIDSSGNLLIGTTTSTSRLVVTTKAAGTNTITLVGGLASNFTGDSAINFQGYNSSGGFGASGTILVTQDASGNTSAGRMTFSTSAAGGVGEAERMRIDSDGNLMVGTTTTNPGLGNTTTGINLRGGSGNNYVVVSRSGNTPLYVNRSTNDGTLVEFNQDGTTEGTISVSGTTVSYNGGHLSRYAQTQSAKDESFVKGTVLSNLDEMNVYTKDGQPVANEQLNKVKVSDTEGDVNVAGVFVNWSYDEQHSVDEINMAMTGDMIIRIAQGVTVARGDLLMSAGDGTAKPQGDDIVRSKTVAKVTSTHVTCTYADGSYCVPCVLMAC